VKLRIALLVVASAALVTSSTASARNRAGKDGAVDRALSYLKSHSDQLHFGAGQEAVASDVIVDANGTEHVRFDRKYFGLRVIGGDVVVHGMSSGDFLGATQTLRVDLSLDRKAWVSPGEAIKIAGGGKPEIVIWARGQARLAYEVVNDADESEPHTIVDAQSGAILDQWPGIEDVTGTGNGFFNGTFALETAVQGTGFRLLDPSRGSNFTCDMRNRTSSCYYLDDADNVWGNGTLSNNQTVAADAQYGTAMTWDYYKTVLGRNGIANDGKGAYNRVHYSKSYNNAFWSDSCFCMTYGDGDAVTYNPFDSLDVAGHEMSHGVTSRTAKLVYSGESGGLNEANSDIFGTMVEYFANNSKDTGDYKIGEKLYKTNPGESKALRYMYNPALDGKSPNCWSSTLGSLDVHYSSGVANHFYYLLAEGSSPAAGPASPTCNGSTLTGIGRAAAQRIWYRALTVYMTSGTNYAAARTATLSAAGDLYGIGSTQQNAVNAAWAAVSVT
jgi:Zn-dependent metalloprotease